MNRNIPDHLGKYQLIKSLGRGQTTEVFLAQDTQLARTVAIKLLHTNMRSDPAFLACFAQEAQIAASLRHLNIVQVHEFQIERHFAPVYLIPYMVMTYIEGKTLDDYLEESSRAGNLLSSLELVALFNALGQAIDYVHSKGFIHRDIRPAHILLDSHQSFSFSKKLGRPILTDFGQAQMFGEVSAAEQDQQQGAWLYKAPEQLAGQQTGPASDLYALGVILYEIVTGIRPFFGASRMDVLMQQWTVMPQRPSTLNQHVPAALDAVILRCIAPDPQNRYASAAELVQAMAQALNVPLARMPGSGKDSTLTETMIEIGGPMIRSELSRQHPLTPTRAHTQPPAPPAGKARYVPPYIYGGVVLALLVVISVVLGYMYHPSLAFNPTPLPSTSTAVYTSSGQFDNRHAVGMADGLLLDIHNVVPPQPGKSYYAWLLGDIHRLTAYDKVGPPPINAPILLSTNLPVDNGTIHYLYSGDARHDNLLSATSRLLITEEDSHADPHKPSSDRATWRYYATLPQQPIQGDPKHLSALTHLRHLLYGEANTGSLGPVGGLDIWLIENTDAVWDLINNARDLWHRDADTSTLITMKNLFSRILVYLDGVKNYYIDVPAGTTLVSDQPALFGLLTVNPLHQGLRFRTTNPDGYVNHIQYHLAQIASASAITPAVHASCIQITHDLNTNIRLWLENVRSDDRAILLSALADLNTLRSDRVAQKLDEMMSLISAAYYGKLDSQTGQMQNGVVQVHFALQQMATMQVTKNLPAQL